MTTPKRIWSVVALLITVTFAAATLAHAQVPEPPTGIPDHVLSTAVSAGGWIYICPAGDGETLAGAGATITVTLLDGAGVPVTNFPKEDIWVESVVPGDLIFCPGGNIADFNTDVDGITFFAGTLTGGGCTQGGLQVVVSGMALAGEPLAIDVNSPDITGDLQVDLCDYIAFATAFNELYAFCIDYDHNSLVNIIDIAHFNAHYCSACQGGAPTPVIASGEIGVFFDTAGTQTGILGITPGNVFDFYVVALSAPDGIQAYQFGISIDGANVTIVDKTVMPVGSNDFAAGDPNTVVVTPIGGCLQVAGPTVLTHFQAMITAPVTDSPICLGSAQQLLCDFSPTGPTYLSCLEECDWRQFNPAYSGCAFINGMGPVATESTSWGGLKALFRY